jgi:dTDP-4-amino-4,6-dideoxygalactose transaminase
MQRSPKIKIAVGGLTIGPLAKRLIARTLDRNRLTYGPLTSTFESRFARLHGARYGLFTVSGTAALQVALHAMKSIHHWKDGDEVIVPAVTFVATPNVVIENNLTPVFVDVDPALYLIDASKIEAAITRRTRAIMPVHLFGQPAPMEEIMRIARRHRLKVVADSCETMLVRYRGRPLGAWGDIVCFSTYAAHLLVTGVGGLAITQSPAYATKMRSLMNHGRDAVYYNIDQDDRVRSAKALFKMVDRRFSFVDVGYSYRLTELEAAIGIEGLGKLRREVAARRRHYAFLLRHLEPFSTYLQLPTVRRWSEAACMMFPIVIRPNARLRRDDLISFLENHGIETRYAMPVLSQPAYRERFGNLERRYPVARWLDRNGFYIGCHSYLQVRDLRYVVDVFTRFFRRHGNR